MILYYTIQHLFNLNITPSNFFHCTQTDLSEWQMKCKLQMAPAMLSHFKLKMFVKISALRWHLFLPFAG